MSAQVAGMMIWMISSIAHRHRLQVQTTPVEDPALTFWKALGQLLTNLLVEATHSMFSTLRHNSNECH